MTDARFIDIGVFLASVQQGFFFAGSVWSGCQVSIDWKMRLVRLDSISYCRFEHGINHGIIVQTWQFPSDASLLHVFRLSAIPHVKLERSLFPSLASLFIA